jgi:chlorobactene glucosyltransferase
MPLEQLLQPHTIIAACIAGMASVFLGFALINTRLLGRLPTSAPSPACRVSVLVPARNEERCIENCVRSICEQNVDDLEVIVLNDQSEDSTGEILERLTLEYSNLKVINGTPLPTGWVGKSWACHNLSMHATGDILIFTDADTVHHQGLIARSVAYMTMHKIDMLSLVPRQIMTSFAEHAVIPIVHMIFFATWLNIRRVARNTTTPSAAIGQFIAFTRQAYTTVGGHERVRYSLVEDVFLAKAAAQDNLRSALINGTDGIDCHMYTSASEVTRGFSKNLFPAMRYNLAQMGAFIVQQIMLYVLPLVLLIEALLDGSEIVMGLAGYALLATLLIRLIISRSFSFPSWHAFLQPISALWCVVICLNSVRWAYSQSGSQWKGRSYARKEQ